MELMRLSSLRVTESRFVATASGGKWPRSRRRSFADRASRRLERYRSVRTTRRRANPQTNEDVSPEKEDQEEEEEEPIWVRREKLRTLQAAEASEKFALPFYVSLPIAAVIAIAAIGSVFEFINRNPVFGVIPPESPFWLPILAFFALTGLPVSGYFFFSAVEAANKMADQMDKVDKA